MSRPEQFRFQLHTRFGKELTTEETPLRLVFDEHEVTMAEGPLPLTSDEGQASVPDARVKQPRSAARSR
jgi:hypothetical protein